MAFALVQRMALVGMLCASCALAPASFAAASETYAIEKWEAGPGLPDVRREFGMVLIPSSTNSSSSGHVMVAGGYSNGKNLDSVYILDLDARTWSGAAAAMPVAPHGFGMVLIPSSNSSSRGHVMVAGGIDNSEYSDSVYMYNVDADKWSGPAAAMPVARYGFGMVHIPSADGVGRGQVMVAGGKNPDKTLDSVYMYNVDADKWSGPVAAMPVASRYVGMVHLPPADGVGRGQVMVAGGKNKGGYLDAVYRLDVDADKWSGCAATMPVARDAFGMVHIPSADGVGRRKIMVAGGYSTGVGYLDSVYMYDVDADTCLGDPAPNAVVSSGKKYALGSNHIGCPMLCYDVDGGPSDCTWGNPATSPQTWYQWYTPGTVQVLRNGGGDWCQGCVYGCDNIASGQNQDKCIASCGAATHGTGQGCRAWCTRIALATLPSSIATTTSAWNGSAATMPVAREYFGMVHIPSVDGVGRGQIMVAGGYNGVDLDSVYFSVPVTTTITTSSATATTTTTTTTSLLGVNSKCDPLADACNASAGLACSADVYGCRYSTATLESQVCPACTDSGSCPPCSAAGVAVLAVLLVASLAANGWFVYKNRNNIQMLRQQLAEQELGGGRRQQTVAMVANPLARRSSGRQTAGRVAGRATAAAAAFLPPQEQSASAYAEPASDGVSTYQSGASYAPVYAVYAGSTPAAPAAGVPLDSHNYVLDTSA